MTTLLADFAAQIESVRARYGGSIISWGRSEKHNKEVGGHEDSFHLIGLAVDIFFDTQKGIQQATKLFRRLGLWTKKNGDLTLHVQALHPEDS